MMILAIAVLVIISIILPVVVLGENSDNLLRS
jgi:hypothetical protein